MLITFKTLQQKTFKIEIEDSEKVKVLKEKIAAERGDEFPVGGQKLIYAGKILDDDKNISEYNIDPVKNFVVVMAVKPKPKPAAEKPKDTEQSTSQTASATTSSSTTETSTASTTNSTATASATTTDTSSTTTTPSTVTPAESALLTGSALESSITELMSLGYSREQVMRALNSSFHNADRAAEYLLSGNIPDLPDEEGTDEDIIVPPTSGGDTPAVAPTGGVPSSGDLQFLRSLPQFQMMRNQVQSHPETLPTLLQEIGRSNPQLLQLISQNQEAFIALLNESTAGEGETGGVGGGEAGGVGEGVPRGGLQIQVTTEEKAVIDRIVAMGFPESEVIQAFFACEKNEQFTINLLLNN